MCPHCHSLAIEVVTLSGRGTLYSYAILHHPQHPAFDYPVLAALVDLEEGVQIVSNLTMIAPEDIRIGMPLEVLFAPTAHGGQVPRLRPRSGPHARDRDFEVPPAAIAGIGSTEFYPHAMPGRSELQLACEAITAALTDAGIEPGPQSMDWSLHDRARSRRPSLSAR